MTDAPKRPRGRPKGTTKPDTKVDRKLKAHPDVIAAKERSGLSWEALVRRGLVAIGELAE